MFLPVAPPVDPMLARLGDHVPAGEEWVYEPKWDGFRTVVFRDDDHIHVASRDHKPLERYFPELPPALAVALPDRCVVDGEIVVVGDSGLDFDALLQRIHPARSRIELLARRTPATYVAFDLLARGDRDLRGVPFEQRRAELEEILGPGADPRAPAAPGTQVLLTPQTEDATEAESWMTALEDIGLDGVVAKRRAGPYIEGERAMFKVKLQRTVDCVVGGYRLSKAGDGSDRCWGSTTPPASCSTSATRPRTRLPSAAPSWPASATSEARASPGAGRRGRPGRWARGRETSWFTVAPVLVGEVAFDRLMSGRFRHAIRFLRWRPERDPKQCTFDQIAPGRG
jgi:ATP-dependent DNA ligase